ncbi:MAG: hypothetical protein E6I59_14500 [Chloroflexi bacterium]|nr:MAG: hypothetical protein AUH05_11805 [Ktedonobacter sp. 13_2_20CM_53_11]TMC35377.1 MAG: hypothetical protein E6J31_15695 [Chloroflexota bacterium]TMD74781.1 MAG: hypothetical protein E6I97_15115 [Chloroflexota bacterium]TME60148.1 MAG: hypothetical protein E6I59_14500 [Chloroflexota bacterium]
MSSITHNTSLSKDATGVPIVHLSYECILRERGREFASYLYEIACSITYPMTSAYLSVRVTGENTYRNAAAREVAFTRHEAGATTYVELLEAERLEVRIVERDGTYCKALYAAHGQELSEQYARGVVSTILRIDAAPDRGRDE